MQFFDFAFDSEATSNYRRDEQIQLDQMKSAVEQKKQKQKQNEEATYVIKIHKLYICKGLTSGPHEELKQLNTNK